MKNTIFLAHAQKYKLEQLADICIERKAKPRLEEIHNNENYGIFDLSYQLRLVKKRIEHLEEKASYQKERDLNHSEFLEKFENLYYSNNFFC